MSSDAAETLGLTPLSQNVISAESEVTTQNAGTINTASSLGTEESTGEKETEARANKSGGWDGEMVCMDAGREADDGRASSASLLFDGARFVPRSGVVRVQVLLLDGDGNVLVDRSEPSVG